MYTDIYIYIFPFFSCVYFEWFLTFIVHAIAGNQLFLMLMVG